jgi:hypothetical protein
LTPWRSGEAWDIEGALKQSSRTRTALPHLWVPRRYQTDK